jgi:SAM-dependent methyltransferase
MTANPATQYVDDRNLAARQRLWTYKLRPFDVFAWVLDLAGIAPGQRVLDVGCGNGNYLRVAHQRGVDLVGCDLSVGMLRAARPHGRRLVNGDAARLPFPDAAFDVVLAPHMLYHLPDIAAGVRELRRVLRPEGVAVAVTNGAGHMRSLWDVVAGAVHEIDPRWEANRSVGRFSLENGAAQLAVGFAHVELVRVVDPPPVELTDPEVAADYVASVADHYQDGVGRPWSEVVDAVRRAAAADIAARGAFTIESDTGAFVCR